VNNARGFEPEGRQGCVICYGSVLPAAAAADAHVINIYQLLKSLNPDMEVLTEVMLSSDMAYLTPSPPMCDALSSHPHLLSPAYMSGSGEPYPSCCLTCALLDEVSRASAAVLHVLSLCFASLAVTQLPTAGDGTTGRASLRVLPSADPRQANKPNTGPSNDACAVAMCSLPCATI
jgi:hypothetical protein